MRLTHLTLRNWRNFKEADFPVQDRLVVLGPNASGKSNLLDALRFLRQVASAGGGFQEAVQSRGGIPRVRCLAARNFNHGHVTIGVRLGDGDRADRWSYELTFARESRGLHRPILSGEVVKRDGNVVLERPDDNDQTDSERLTQTYLEAGSRCRTGHPSGHPEPREPRHCRELRSRVLPGCLRAA